MTPIGNPPAKCLTISQRALKLRELAKLHASPDTVKLLNGALIEARTRYTTNRGLLDRMQLQAQLLRQYFTDPNIAEFEVTTACVVMMALAVRLCEEGDAEFSYRGLKHGAVLEAALDEFYKDVVSDAVAK